MLDTTSFTPAQSERLRRFFHGMNHFMVFLWKLGMGRLVNVWPEVSGRIMVICHRGRKSGRAYMTPVNYATVDKDIYCLAGFGDGTDWYRNILANPDLELWLPEGRRRAHGCDTSDTPMRARLLRAIIIAAGFAGPLMGVDQRKLTDQQLLDIGKDYRIVRFTLEP